MFAAYSKRTVGQVADVLYVGFHHPKPMIAVLRFEGKVAKSMP